MRYLDSCWFVLLLSSTQVLAQVLRPPHQQKWQQIQTPTEPQIQTQEVYRLLDRIQNNLSSHFLISIESQVTVFKNPPQKSHILHQCEGSEIRFRSLSFQRQNSNQTFWGICKHCAQADQTVRLDKSATSASTKIEVTASTGVLAAWGIHHYLKYNCGWHFSWDTIRVSNCSWPSPVSFNLTANDRFRYYQNVCTPGYSFTFWQWPQWEAHIDWMALNGINLPLAFTAQEYIWIQVYKQVKISLYTYSRLYQF